GDVAGLQRNDVPADGASRRSAGSARHVRDIEYTTVLPERVNLSDQCFSEMASGDCMGRPILLRGARIQGGAAETGEYDCNYSGPALPVYVRDRHAAGCCAALQAYALKVLPSILGTRHKGNRRGD